MASSHHAPSKSYESYYVPEQSKWPFFGSVGLFLVMGGLGTAIIHSSAGTSTKMGWWMFLMGFLVMTYILFNWFANVAKESMTGLYSSQMDRSFRWGMSWFIFSEVMFFAAFFGALFYARVLSVPWLGGAGEKGISHELWQGFEATWPLLKNPDNTAFPGASEVVDPWKIPLLNTILLLTSSVTVTIAHKALKQNNRGAVKLWLGLTIALGFTFLGFQIHEYMEAYQHLHLTLKSGIYGTTFFMLTGFHGAHVTLGAIILSFILIRIFKGHFDKDQHFGFEAASWYWHFVDVVWLCLFLFVYIL